MSEDEKDYKLPRGWTQAGIGELLGPESIFCDGDWVESKDQDPSGDVRLIQLADVGDGNYRNRSNRFLTSTKAADLHCTYIQPGDLLIARMPDPLGRACIFPGDTKGSVTVVDVCVVRLDSPIDRRWLMHQLNTPQMRERVAALQSGSTRKRISRANLAKITFPVPPLSEQERIASVTDELFSDLDFAVGAVERARGKLNLYRTSILKAAVEGELTAEWRAQHPDTESASELLKRILAERRHRWEEEQLRGFNEKGKKPPENWKSKYKEPMAPKNDGLEEQPKGWCWATLDQLSVLVTSGSRGWKEYYSDGGAIFIRSQDIRTDRLKLDDVAHVCPPANSEGTRTQVSFGDLLVTITGANVAKAALVDVPVPEAYVSQHVGLIRLVVPELSKFAHMYAVAPSGGRKKLIASAYGAGKPGLNLDHLRELCIPLTSLEEQEAIVETVEDQLSVIAHLEADLATKLASAKALQYSILRLAFEGKLVPQDPNDEPASELLKRIAASREERTREAMVKKSQKHSVNAAKSSFRRTRAK